MGKFNITRSPRTVKKHLIRWGLSLGGLYLLTCLLLFWQQRRLIFAPSRAVKHTPADYQLTYEDVNLTLSAARPFGNRMEKIHGWWIPSQKPNARTVLYLHGNGLNIGANAKQASRFHELGLSVFLFDYRGYGKSEGEFPSEASVYLDAERAWDYLFKERKIEPGNILIYGHSLGGAIAINLALQHPDASGLVVQSSFTSTLEMARRNWWTAIFPIDALMNQRFDSIHKVSELKLPTLYIHGNSDKLIPSNMSQQLYDSTRSPKYLELFPEAGHNNVAQVGGATYSQVIETFIRQSSPKDKFTTCGESTNGNSWHSYYRPEQQGEPRPVATLVSNSRRASIGQNLESLANRKALLACYVPDPIDLPCKSPSSKKESKGEPLW
jgi:uncharacterized protein